MMDKIFKIGILILLSAFLIIYSQKDRFFLEREGVTFILLDRHSGEVRLFGYDKEGDFMRISTIDPVKKELHRETFGSKNKP